MLYDTRNRVPRSQFEFSRISSVPVIFEVTQAYTTRHKPVSILFAALLSTRKYRMSVRSLKSTGSPQPKLWLLGRFTFLFCFVLFYSLLSFHASSELWIV